MLKKQLKPVLACCFALFALNVNAQSFVPSAQQIEQFKNLPRAQQEQLAKQMGFDVSVLDTVNGQLVDSNLEQQIDFVERKVDETDASSELAKQSVIETESAKLEPFGYDIFDTRKEASKPSANIPVPPNYVIGPGDSVKLQLFGKETGNYELLVSNDGNVDIPELGPLNVVGISFKELKELIQKKYEQQKIGVTPFLSMGQLKTIQIFLVGEVYQPGPLVVNGLSTITTALINSGGINSIGSLRNIQLKRNGKTVSNFDLYDLVLSGDNSKDVRLEQGDVLFVPTARNIVSVGGQVRRPAIYEMQLDETVKDLLDLVGGVLPSADTSSIQLVRSQASNGLSILNLSLLDRSSLATKLMNGDFIRVPKANLEFNNAIAVRGAINLPSIIAVNGLSISSLVTKRSVLASTDMEYALLLRKGRFDSKTTVIQFKPLDIINNNYDLELEAFDELVFFDRVALDDLSGDAKKVVEGDLKSSHDDLKSLNSTYLQKVESERFTTEVLHISTNESSSRKALLAPIIARLKSEATNEHPVQLVELTGQVKYPGVYPVFKDAVLEDMLTAAGGLTESAHLKSAEITRVLYKDGTSRVTHQKVNLYDELQLPKIRQVRLQSKDILTVVRIPKWYENNIIEIKGEVVFPGVYQVSEGETLSSVIERAGGLTDKASIDAAVFSREELKIKEQLNIDKAVDDLRQQLANNNLSTSQFSRVVDYQSAMQVLDDLSDVEPLGRMVIDLEAILKADEENDIIVRNGDILAIPNVTPAVSIIGEVFVSTTHMFERDLTINDYINLAGGIREYGDESKIYLVRANGSVFIPESNFWFSNDKDKLLKPGDTIVVPREVTNYDNISLWQGVTQIVYQTAVALAAIGSL